MELTEEEDVLEAGIRIIKGVKKTEKNVGFLWGRKSLDGVALFVAIQNLEAVSVLSFG